MDRRRKRNMKDGEHADEGFRRGGATRERGTGGHKE